MGATRPLIAMVEIEAVCAEKQPGCELKAGES